MLEYLVFVLFFFPNEYFIIIIYIKYVPTRPFCWMIISVEHTTVHYYAVHPASLQRFTSQNGFNFFPEKFYTHLMHILVMQQLKPWHASLPLLGWFGAFKAVEALYTCPMKRRVRVPLSAASAGLQTISHPHHPASASPAKLFCCADHNSWQPCSPTPPPPALTQPSSAPRSE